jgi:hypothetical protein
MIKSSVECIKLVKNGEERPISLAALWKHGIFGTDKMRTWGHSPLPE